MLKKSFKLILVVALIGLSVADEMEDLMKMLRTTCLGESGADEALVIKANAGDFADDEKLKCYMRCTYDQMATMSDDGIIDEEGVIALLPDPLKDILGPTIRKCGTKIGANPCDNAWLTYKCYQEVDPKNFFLI